MSEPTKSLSERIEDAKQISGRIRKYAELFTNTSSILITRKEARIIDDCLAELARFMAPPSDEDLERECEDAKQKLLDITNTETPSVPMYIVNNAKQALGTFTRLYITLSETNKKNVKLEKERTWWEKKSRWFNSYLGDEGIADLKYEEGDVWDENE